MFDAGPKTYWIHFGRFPKQWKLVLVDSHENVLESTLRLNHYKSPIQQAVVVIEFVKKCLNKYPGARICPNTSVLSIAYLPETVTEEFFEEQP